MKYVRIVAMLAVLLFAAGCIENTCKGFGSLLGGAGAVLQGVGTDITIGAENHGAR